MSTESHLLFRNVLTASGQASDVKARVFLFMAKSKLGPIRRTQDFRLPNGTSGTSTFPWLKVPTSSRGTIRTSCPSKGTNLNRFSSVPVEFTTPNFLLIS